MSGVYVAAGLALFIGGLVLVLMKAAARGGRMEEAAQNVADKAKAAADLARQDQQAIGRMADADAASVGQPADRVRDRLRKRPPTTR
ncbi:MAG: hypothetical protein V4720_06265 [Pseudomonadota bacterium]